MSLLSNSSKSYRDDFTFRNSAAAIARFPFPFSEDLYMYGMNIEPAIPGASGSVYEFQFDIDEHYQSEMAERAIVLEKDPRRYLVLPHMQSAAWDALQMLMEHLSADYPEYFELSRSGDHRWWTNHLLGIDQPFKLGDASTLPCEPLEFIMRQVQGDVALLDQRDGDLFMDAGMITFPANWSLQFDIGMSFKQWHSPVPLAHEQGIFDRALQHVLAIRIGQPIRRLNWTLTINPRLDTSPETFHEWGSDRSMVTAENAGDIVHLRADVQLMIRLPRSNALMFCIRTYLISLRELATDPLWARRMHRVLRDLPATIADYKGIAKYREPTLAWLSQFDTAA